MKKNPSRRTLAAASIGNFGEIYDFAVFGFSVPVIAALFFPGTDRTAALLSTFAVYAVAFFARPLGGLLFGCIADRVGRIKVLSLTVWLMAGSTMMIGLLPTYDSIGIAAPVVLVLARIAQGLAMGGETTGSAAFVLESAPDDHRGRWTGLALFFAYLPNAFVAVLLFVLQSSAGAETYRDWVWRLPFLAGGLIGIVGFWLRNNLDDPDEFKQAAKAPHASPLHAASHAGVKCMTYVVMVQPILAVGSYLLLGFMYTFLVRQVKMDPATALLTNAAAIAALAILLPIAGALSDRIGRRVVLRIGAVWIALVVYPALQLAASGSVSGALIGQVLIAIGVGLYGGAAFTAMAEFFPTAFRATGHAIAYQLTVAIFGGTTPFICAWLIARLQSPLAPGVYAALVAVVCLIAVRWVPETKGISLRTSVIDPVKERSSSAPDEVFG